MIKFLTGSCLNELGIVLKEPSRFYVIDGTTCQSRNLYLCPGQVLSLRTLIHEFFQKKI